MAKDPQPTIFERAYSLSEDARLFYYAGVALCWQVSDFLIDESELRAACGLDAERFDRAGAELYDCCMAWPTRPLGRWGFEAAEALIKHAMGPAGRPPARVWAALRAKTFAELGAICLYCGATEDLAVDHIVPLHLGGSNHPRNLAPACGRCNSSKGGKTLLQWRDSGGWK